MTQETFWPCLPTKFSPSDSLIWRVSCPPLLKTYTRQVLMLAWMNEEAFRATMTTRRATYFSRSRQRLWVKGETSGNSQQVVQLRLDCDGDAVLLLVEQQGSACHTGEQSCFDVGGADVR